MLSGPCTKAFWAGMNRLRRQRQHPVRLQRFRPAGGPAGGKERRRRGDGCPAPRFGVRWRHAAPQVAPAVIPTLSRDPSARLTRDPSWLPSGRRLLPHRPGAGSAPGLSCSRPMELEPRRTKCASHARAVFEGRDVCGIRPCPRRAPGQARAAIQRDGVATRRAGPGISRIRPARQYAECALRLRRHRQLRHGVTVGPAGPNHSRLHGRRPGCRSPRRRAAAVGRV